MDPVTAGIIGIIVLIILILARMPVGAALILVGLIGFGCVFTFEATLEVLKTVPWTTFSSQALSLWPLWFLVLGLCLTGGLANDLFDTFNAGLKRCRAGMAVAAMFICALFGPMSVFSRIGLVPLAKMIWPAMQKQGYSPSITAGVITAGFSLSVLLPLPSILVIIYGVITEQNIGFLFLGGLIPTAISIILYLAAIMFWRWRKPADMANVELPAFKNGTAGFSFAWDGILLFVFAIAAIMSGVFTPTETVALASVLVVIFVTVRKRLNLKTYSEACKIALTGAGWLFILILGAMAFGYFLTATRLPYTFSENLYYYNSYMVLVLMLIIVVALGCIFDAIPIILLAVPCIFPAVLKQGFDPIWFGIIAVRCIGLGLMLPYGGINLRLVQKITGVSSRAAAKGVMPFVCADILLIIMLIICPGISLWLPNALMN